MLEWYTQPQYQPFALTHDDENTERPGMLMIHGFTGTPDEMRPAATIAFDAGFDVEVPVLPGMGADIARFQEVDRYDWLEAIMDRWHEVTARYRQYVLAGYSLGGTLAIHASVAQPAAAMVLMSPLIRLADPRAVFLPLVRHVMKAISPFGTLDFSHPDARAFFARTMPGLEIDLPEVQDAVRREFVMPTRLLNECRLVGREAGRKARFVREPVTMIQGRPDPVVNHHNTRWLADHLAGPVDYHEIPGDHLIPYPGADSWSTVQRLLAETFAIMFAKLTT